MHCCARHDGTIYMSPMLALVGPRSRMDATQRRGWNRKSRKGRGKHMMVMTWRAATRADGVGPRQGHARRGAGHPGAPTRGGGAALGLEPAGAAQGPAALADRGAHPPPRAPPGRAQRGHQQRCSRGVHLLRQPLVRAHGALLPKCCCPCIRSCAGLFKEELSHMPQLHKSHGLAG